MDGDDPPVVYDVLTLKSEVVAWGLPPRSSWFSQCTRFLDSEVTHSSAGDSSLTLEKYLGLTRLPGATEKGE
jgi:hypothetical protein